MFDSEAEAIAWCAAAVARPGVPSHLPDCKHAFTHFYLTLLPLSVTVSASPAPQGYRWYDPARPDRIGLSKPALDLIAAITPRDASPN